MTRTLLIIVLLAAACGGGAEAPEVRLPVATRGAVAAATSDLGYTVTVSRLRVAVQDLQLTVAGGDSRVLCAMSGRAAVCGRAAGEMHKVGVVEQGLVAPHPGHNAGGEVTGELPGRFVLEWDGQERAVGTATLLVGDYNGANVGFRRADAGDGLAADDPLIGHTFHVVGTAARGGAVTRFDAALDIEPGTELVGAVFDHDVVETSTETLYLGFVPTDPFEGDTAFDGVDFAALPAGADGVTIRPAEVAHNLMRRTLQVHDHYAIEAP